MRMKRGAILLTVCLAATLLGPAAAATHGESRTIFSSGPLNRVDVGDDLHCAVERNQTRSFFGETACGTFLGVGDTVYGPHSIPAGPDESATGYEGFTPVSQTAVTGNGTEADPFSVTTVAEAGDSGLTVEQTDTYAAGSDRVSTSIEVRNNNDTAVDIVTYRAGDCFFRGDDAGFGAVETDTAGVSCVEGVVDSDGTRQPGEGRMTWQPDDPENTTWLHHRWPNGFWNFITSGDPLPNECNDCDGYGDNAFAIAWEETIPAGASVTLDSDLILTQSSAEAAGTVSSRTGSVMERVNAQGERELVIAFPSFDRSDLTLRAEPECADGSDPTNVQIQHGDNTYDMSQNEDGTWTTTIPEDELTDAPVTLTYDCDDGPQSDPIGEVTLYDPSGFVTDEITGEPVVGASVTLHQVPGWSPRQPDDPEDEPETCQSNLTRDEGEPWSQEAPTDEGVAADPDTAPIDPRVQPFTTDHRGYYGWDVGEGCWYVTVSHPDYQSLTSPVVGVPPEVTDLDLQLTPTDTSGLPPSEVSRLAGAGRAQTAAEISAATFEPGVQVAYVATQGNFPDALTGGPAAALDGGPILLTGRDALPQATADELARLQPERIVVLGGTSAVSEAVANDLTNHATTGQVDRLSGPNRFDTAAAVSEARFEPGTDVAFVATGEQFPDALAGGASAARLAGPVLLTSQGDLPEATADELTRLQPGRIVVLGGSSAVSDAVLADLEGFTDGEVTRRSGADRFDTAASIAGTFAPPLPTVYVATGSNFPDALAGVPAAGQRRGPVLLVPGTSVPDAVAEQLERLQPHRIVVLGGSAAVSDGVESELQQYLRD